MKTQIHDLYIYHLRRADRSIGSGQNARAAIAARQALNIHPDSYQAQALLDEAQKASADRPQ